MDPEEPEAVPLQEESASSEPLPQEEPKQRRAPPVEESIVEVSHEYVDANTKRVVAEAAKKCREKGFKVDLSIAAFVARAQDVQAESSSGTHTSYLGRPELTDSDISMLGARVCEVLLVPDSPFLSTLRMQLQMEEVFQKQKRAVEADLNTKEDQLEKYIRLMQQSQVNPDGSLKDFQSIYEYAFSYCCLRANLPDPASNSDLRGEVFAAFESILPLHIMPRFIGFSEDERLQQLEEVAAIMLGVCAYNAQTGQAGIALARVFSIVGYAQQAARLKKEINDRARRLEELIEQYMRALNHQGQKLAPDHPLMGRLRDEVTHVQQELAYALQLEEDIVGALEAVQQIEMSARGRLKDAHALVESHRTAVPKDQVFPLFDEVGGLYLQLEDERKMLNIRQKLYEALKELQGGYTPRLNTNLMREALAAGSRALAGSVVTLEGSRPDPGMQPDASEITFLAAESIGPDQKVELGGYCPVALVRRGGLLVPASTELGFVEAEGRVFGCSSRAYLQDFANYHAFYTDKLQSAVALHPELVKLIGLAEDFPTLALAPIVEVMSSGLQCDFATQTPTHYVERHVDVNYEWNVWSLRRKALRLANLRQCRTHSAQTVLSHFRRENETQTWKPKVRGTQTAAAKGTSMPKKLQYVAGLRGSAKAQMAVCRLELDIGQPHEF